jgi:predicted dehydrogenase
VYCDKPLARTLMSEEIVQLARTRPDLVCRMTFIIVRAGHSARQGLVDEVFLGQVLPVPRGLSFTPATGPWAGPRTWRLQMSRSGGGALMDLGAHALICALSCGRDCEVNADLRTFIEERPDPQTGEFAPWTWTTWRCIRRGRPWRAVGVIEASRRHWRAGRVSIEIHGSAARSPST